MNEFKEYPRCMYGHDDAFCIVNNKEEQKRLEFEGWATHRSLLAPKIVEPIGIDDAPEIISALPEIDDAEESVIVIRKKGGRPRKAR